MIINDNDGQMMFGDLGGLKLPDNCLTGEENLEKNIPQETFPDRGSNPGPLRDRRACYHLPHLTDEGVPPIEIHRRMLDVYGACVWHEHYETVVWQV